MSNSLWPPLTSCYMDIHASGGGIYYTVSCVHKAGLDQLAASFSNRLSAMMKCGTTRTVEPKACVVMPITTIRMQY